RPLFGWATYGVVTLLFAYTHYCALFSLAAQAVFLAGYLVRTRGGRLALFGRALFAYGVVAAGWLPWLPVFLGQRAQAGAAPGSAWSWGGFCAAFYQMFLYPESAAEFPHDVTLGAVAISALALVALL